MKLEVHRHCLGTPWTYQDLDRRQREIAEEILVTSGPGVLLLSELAPVITRGRRTPQADTSLIGVNTVTPVVDVDRGGLATYHGPGQWVLFPVNTLQTLTGDPRGVRKIVNLLLDIAATVGRCYTSDIEIRCGAELGVWTSVGKIAAVGVHIMNGIVLHGLSLNGFRTPSSFVGLRPCGLDASVDFMIKTETDTENQFKSLGDILVQTALDKFAI